MLSAKTTRLRQLFVLVVFTLLAGLLSVSLVTAQGLIQPDGRINQVAHFGGDALYCVDSSGNATTDYANMIVGGGMRLLDIDGQELWFVPDEDILAAIAESLETNGTVMMGSGQGSYGPARLYTYFDGEQQMFVFSGYDEYGKPNSLTFVPCIPVGAGKDTDSKDSDSGESEVVTYCVVEFGPPGKRLAPINGLDGGIPIGAFPCDECPEAPPLRNGFKGARTDVAGGGGEPGKDYIILMCLYEGAQ